MSNKIWCATISALVLAVCAGTLLFSRVQAAEAQDRQSSRLAVVWTSGDPEVAHRVCLMYTHAAKTNGWFDEVRIIIWGPSARLLAADKDLQAKVKSMMDDGVIVQACIVCADSYGVADALRGLDIEVKAMGKPLTEMVTGEYKVLTF